MSIAPARAAFAIAVSALVGCSSKDAATSDTSSAAPVAAAEAPEMSTGSEPTAADISNYKLDMDKMTKYVAAIKGFSKLSKSDSAVAAAMSTDSNESTAQMIAKLNANPVARSVLANAGLNAKEYVWITAAWLQAAMTQGIMESTPGAKMPEGQNPQNTEFLKANKAQLEAMMRDAGMTQ